MLKIIRGLHGGKSIIKTKIHSSSPFLMKIENKITTRKMSYLSHSQLNSQVPLIHCEFTTSSLKEYIYETSIRRNVFPELN